LGGIFEEHSGVAIKGAAYPSYGRGRGGKHDVMDMQVNSRSIPTASWMICFFAFLVEQILGTTEFPQTTFPRMPFPPNDVSPKKMFPQTTFLCLT
jgi:hypothetical protein